MAAISSPGLGSGLDVNSIVTQLVDATREPVDQRNDSKQEKYDSQISDLGRVKSAISDLNDTLFDLKLPTTFSRRKVEHSSEKFDVEAGSAALPASYDIKVDKVAQSQRITSKAFDNTVAVGAGTLTVKNGTNSFDITVDVDDTIDVIAQSINSSASNFGVTATIVKGDAGSYLVLESDETGIENVLELEVTDDDGLQYDNSGLSQLAFSAQKTVLDQSFTAGELMNADNVSNGVIQLSNGTQTEDINLLATDTIENAVTKINANSIGVTASLEDDGAGGFKLVLESASTYGDQKVGISIVSDDDLDTTDAVGISKLAHTHSYYNFSETQEAQDAQITVNGSITATSSSNKFEDVITGVIITAKDAHEAADSSDGIEVDLDTGSTKEAITKFVESYNAMMEVMSEVTNADSNAGELGSLVSDNTVRTFLGQIRSKVSDAVEVDTNISLSLSQLGIETQRDGTLSMDEETLDEQIDENFEYFSKFFSNEGGVGRELANVVAEYKGTGGIVDNKIQSINKQLDRLNDDREDFDDKMTRYEARLYSQFNAMDLIVANLNATSQYLEGALSSLPGVVKKESS